MKASAALWTGGFLLGAVCLGGGSEPAWEQGNGHRSAALPAPGPGREGFTLLPMEATGIGFSNRLSDRAIAANRVLGNGSGVALGDVDGDGLCDIYFCRLEGNNALYRNLGNWRFEEITDASGVACPGQYSTGAVFADVDGDGDLDLLVNAIGGGTRLFLNDGRGHFAEKTGTRLPRRFGSTSMALGDIDGDGDLDLYVTNYRTDTYRDRPPGLKVEARTVNGRIVVTPEDRFIPVAPRGDSVEVIELGERDFLFLNDGSGDFLPVSWTNGAFRDAAGEPLRTPPLDWGLSVLMRDFNGDGVPDLYVCNDFFHSPDRLWLSQPSGGYRAAAPTAFRTMSLASMAADTGDLNGDGVPDFLVADMLSRDRSRRHRQRPELMQELVMPRLMDPEYQPEAPRNTLFVSMGDGEYAEVAQLSGLSATEWTWGVAFMDVDLDGDLDLLVANGNTHDVQDADTLRAINLVRHRESAEARLRRFPSLALPNLAFRNMGGLRFEEAGAEWGFQLNGVSHGMALGDLDNDGDLDVVLNNLNLAASLYRNDSGAPRVAVRLKGLPPNRDGIGARIRVTGGGLPAQEREVFAGGRYLSGDSFERVFAAGTEGGPLRIEVLWRSGRRSVVDGARANRIYEIDEARSARGAPVMVKSSGTPLFEDESARLGHRHVEDDFDDFALQPLLNRRLSRLGPGVAWADLDGDGREDLVVGGAAGWQAEAYRNCGDGRFERWGSIAAARDYAGLVAWRGPNRADRVLAADSGLAGESGAPAGALLALDFSGNRATTLAALEFCGGPVAMSDIDGDGDLDLFVGGRTTPRRHPAPTRSLLFRNDEGSFHEHSLGFGEAELWALVSDAVFADLDGDGDDDLILACEWDSIRVFQNDGGRLREVTRALGFEKWTGWWNGIAAGDFDGDGHLDLVASNWGRNTKYQDFMRRPLRVVFADVDGDGTIEALEAQVEGKALLWREFDSVSRVMPFVRAMAPSHRAFGTLTVDEVMKPFQAVARERQARTLDSMVFLNRPGGFEARPLPLEAQFAPAFGIAVADFDGDGAEDIFLAQNFFGVDRETSRHDAGRGALLLGDGRGGFRHVPASGCGIRIHGEQRGCAVADYDGDGRPDLVVTQNNQPTRLYRNAGGRPGLRLRLQGDPRNPAAIGAIARLEFADGVGPARLTRAGGGYWSQDGAPVLATPRPPVALRVRWPGGAETRVPLGGETPREAWVSKDQGFTFVPSLPRTGVQ